MTEPIPQEEETGSQLVRPKNRVTVVEYIQFQERSGGSNILPAGKPYAYDVDSEELPFQRRLKAMSDWKELPGLADWLDGKAGLIKIENMEGQFLQVQPSESESKDIARRVIELGIKVEGEAYRFADVHPGRSIRIEACEGATYVVRTRHGSATYWLHAFPR